MVPLCLSQSPLRLTALISITCAAGLAAAGCRNVSQQDQAEALVVLDTLIRRIERREYDAAMRCFSASSQQRIRNVGGSGTPIEGFFTGLRPMLKQRTDVTTNIGKVWVRYTHSGDKELLVGISRANDEKPEGWEITLMKGHDWRV